VQILWQGLVAAVEDAACKATAEAGAGGGFILRSSCDVPVAAPRPNVEAMVRTGHHWRYPLLSRLELEPPF